MQKLAKKTGALLVLLLCCHASLAQTTKLFGTSTNLTGSVYSLNTNGTTLTTHKIFSPNGSRPLANLVEGPDGKLYGMTSEGGQYVLGVIFKVNTDGTGFTKIHEFNWDDGAQPQGGLVLADDGYFYGMTAFGGQFGTGVLFKINGDGTDFTMLIEFPPIVGSNPQGTLIQASDDLLYGMTQSGGSNGLGVIFTVQTDGGGFTSLHEFNGTTGQAPIGGLFEASDGELYGMTSQGGSDDLGVIFKISRDGSNFTKLLDFDGSNGSLPYGDFIEVGSGTLYGTTTEGGTAGEGVVFKIETNGTGYVKLHDFAGTDGINPRGALVENSDGVLYGLTPGASDEDGVIYKINPNGSGFSTLHTFSSVTASYPFGSLTLASDGAFYGTTTGSSPSNSGTVFKLDPGPDTYSNLFAFENPSGKDVQAELIQGDNGLVYGMTPGGGTNNMGVIFSVKPDGSNYQVLHHFNDTDGQLPYGGLVQSLSGDLLGVTAYGGTSGAGVIFRIKTNGENYTKLYDFNYTAGGLPQGSLVEGGNDDFYGMTNIGGASDKGVIYKINGDGSGFLLLHEFDGTNGANPVGSLTLDGTGNLYGMTPDGGTNDKGVIFKINTDGTGFAKLIDFEGTDGLNPQGSLLLVGADKLYGVSFVEGSLNGEVFSLKTNGTDFTAMDIFPGSFNFPSGSLIQLPSGELCGTTSGGFESDFGIIYKFNENFTGYSEILQLPATNGIPISRLLVADVSKVPQTITFNPVSAGYYNDPPFNLTATASSGLSVSYTSSNTDVATISGNIVTIVGGGTAIITARQAGNATYFAANNVERELIIYKINQTITFNAPPDKSVGDAPFDLGAFSSSGLPISYTSSNHPVATVSGNMATIVGTGTTTITASQPGNSAYNPAADVEQVLTVKLPQTITFNPLVTKYPDDPPFTLSATSSSGLAVSYQTSNSSVATILGNTVTIVGLGTTTITASQEGDATYNPAPHVDQVLLVEMRTQTITFSSLSPIEFGTVPSFGLTATSTSGLPVSYSSSNEDVATISGSTLIITGVGSTIITATQVGNVAYEPAPEVTQTLVVNMGNQTIAFSALPPKTILDPAFDLTAVASSGLTVSYSISDEAVATVSGNTVTIVGLGTTDITATRPGNSNYNPAPDVTQSLTVNKATQTITFNALPSKTILDPAFGLTATASSGLTVSYSSSDEGVATISGNTVTIVAIGTTDITATQPGNGEYNPASDVTQSLTVSKADQTITFGSLPPKTLGGPPFDLTATSSSGLAVTYSSSDPSVATISGNTVTLVAIGSSTITASQAGNGNYNSAPDVTQPLIVNLEKSDQTITFNLLPSKTYGDAPFTLSASSTSALAVSYSTSTASVATVGGNMVTITGAGQTTITASQPGSVDFNPAVDVVQTLTVSKANQAITFNTLPGKAFGDAPFTLSATASSGLTVTYSSGNATVAAVNGSTVTIAGPGTATIMASQAGDTNYEAAASVQQVLTVSKSVQTITFAAVPDKVLGSASFTLSPTSSSGLAVLLTTSSDKLTVAGSVVTLVKAGRATINADQPGNANYQAATTVSQTFCVNPTKPVVTIIAQSSGISTLASSNTVGNQWYLNGNAIAGATAGTLTITQGGSYMVRTIVDNCSSEFSNPVAVVITGDVHNAKSDLLIYPNPAKNELWIRMDGLVDSGTEIQVIDKLGRRLEIRKEWINSEVKLDVSGYGKGLHLLMMQGPGLKVQKSFVKE